jgi:pantoate--beta-alanine ligase
VVLATSLREFRAFRSKFDGGCVLVPTMGALHEGHAALVRRGAELARARGLWAGCVVTVFVNPTQFDEPADLERYPRTPDRDAELCRKAGASCVLMPSVADVYPAGPQPVPVPDSGRLPGLEDAHRPGHFAGVAQVVRRLCEMTAPEVVVLGEKDWQQLQVLSAMFREQGLPISVEPFATVREPDGLAMSSRNRFLTPGARRRGLAISRALREAGAAPDPDAAEAVMTATLAQAGLTPDYAVVREATTLLRPAVPGPGTRWRALVAARVGEVRLLDNAPWPVGPVT